MNPSEDFAQLKRYLEALEQRFQKRIEELKPPAEEKDKTTAYQIARTIVLNNRAHYLSLLQFDPDKEREVVKPVRYTGPPKEYEYFMQVYEEMIRLLGVLHYTHEDLHRLVVRCSSFLDCCAQCNQNCIKRALVCECGTVQYCTERCRRLDAPQHKRYCPNEIKKKDEELKKYRERKARETERAEREQKELEKIMEVRKARDEATAKDKRLRDMAQRRVDLGMDKTVEEAMEHLRLTEPSLASTIDAQAA